MLLPLTYPVTEKDKLLWKKKVYIDNTYLQRLSLRFCCVDQKRGMSAM